MIINKKFSIERKIDGRENANCNKIAADFVIFVTYKEAL